MTVSTYNLTSGASNMAREEQDNTDFVTGDAAVKSSTSSAVRTTAGFNITTNAAHGNQITAATLELQATKANVDDLSCDVHCFAVDDSAFFSASDSPHDRAKTTASTSWENLTSPGTSVITSPDLSDEVQEVFDRAGWAPGNEIGFALVGKNGTAYTFTIDQSAGVELDVTWDWTTTTVDIHKTTGDYSTVQSALDASDTRGGIYIAEITDNAEYTESIDVDTVNGATQDEDRYVRLTAESSVRHDGTPDSGARIRSSSGHVFTLDLDYFVIDHLEVHQDSGNSSEEGFRVNSDIVRFWADSCLILQTAVDASNQADGFYATNDNVTATFTNCILDGWDRDGIAVLGSTGTNTVQIYYSAFSNIGNRCVLMELNGATVSVAAINSWFDPELTGSSQEPVDSTGTTNGTGTATYNAYTTTDADEIVSSNFSTRTQSNNNDASTDGLTTVITEDGIIVTTTGIGAFDYTLKEATGGGDNHAFANGTATLGTPIETRWLTGTSPVDGLGVQGLDMIGTTRDGSTPDIGPLEFSSGGGDGTATPGAVGYTFTASGSAAGGAEATPAAVAYEFTTSGTATAGTTTTPAAVAYQFTASGSAAAGAEATPTAVVYEFTTSGSASAGATTSPATVAYQWTASGSASAGSGAETSPGAVAYEFTSSGTAAGGAATSPAAVAYQFTASGSASATGAGQASPDAVAVTWTASGAAAGGSATAPSAVTYEWATSGTAASGIDVAPNAVLYEWSTSGSATGEATTEPTAVVYEWTASGSAAGAGLLDAGLAFAASGPSSPAYAASGPSAPAYAGSFS